MEDLPQPPSPQIVIVIFWGSWVDILYVRMCVCWIAEEEMPCGSWFVVVRRDEKSRSVSKEVN